MRARTLFTLFAAFVMLSVVGAAPARARVVVDGFADLAESLTPAVVNIASARHDLVDSSDDALDALERKFAPRTVLLGSGFIIDSAGFVVTNYHVVHNAKDIIVTLNDGRIFEASLFGYDRPTDLAVLEIHGAQGASLAAVSFGDSDAARPGDWVIAIGNPFGLGGSISIGIISAMGRNLNSSDYDNFIQTDAAINSGSSGGPLFNLDGDVIGVNTAIFSQSGGSVGVGFAIPASIVEFVVGQLVEYGAVRRGAIGVFVDSVMPAEAAELGLSARRGAKVTGIRPGGPAERANILRDDIILEFDSRSVSSVSALARMTAAAEIGSVVALLVLRDGEELTIYVTIGELQTGLLSTQSAPNAEGALTGSGLMLAAPTPEILDAFGLPPNVEGVIVIAVDPDSPAARTLQPGDVLLEIAWQRVTTPQEAIARLEELKEANSGPVQIFIQRGELLFYESLRP